MKKIVLFFMLILLVSTVVVSCAETATKSEPTGSTSEPTGMEEPPTDEPIYSEGLAYRLNSDGTGYAVVGIGTCTDTNIVIPATYEGKPVTRIGEAAFRGCYGLLCVTIPDSVISIEEYAFEQCVNLTSVTIPDSMTSIGNDAFNYCFRLIEVIDHSSLPITMGSDSCGYIAYYAKTVHNGKTQIVNQDE